MGVTGYLEPADWYCNTKPVRMDHCRAFLQPTKDQIHAVVNNFVALQVLFIHVNSLQSGLLMNIHRFQLGKKKKTHQKKEENVKHYK